jgi:hypothetical protein
VGVHLFTNIGVRGFPHRVVGSTISRESGSQHETPLFAS